MPKVLLVDDEKSILALLKAIMMTRSFTVETADSAAQGIQMLNSEMYDAVVTDLRMETPTAGFDVVRAACNIRPKPVVIIATAFPVPTSQWKAAGADALYRKGGSCLSLPDEIAQLIKERTRTVA